MLSCETPIIQYILQKAYKSYQNNENFIILYEDDFYDDLNFFEYTKEFQKEILNYLKKYFKVSEIYSSDLEESNTGFIFDSFVNLFIDLTNGLVGTENNLVGIKLSWPK